MLGTDVWLGKRNRTLAWKEPCEETANSNNFVGLGTVPLQDIELAITEMERCVTELNMPGLEIGSNINGENLSAKKFFPFYKSHIAAI